MHFLRLRKMCISCTDEQDLMEDKAKGAPEAKILVHSLNRQSSADQIILAMVLLSL